MPPVLAARVVATQVLRDLVGNVDFFLLVSSVAGVVGGVGRLEDRASAAFLDAFAHATGAVVVDWDQWGWGDRGIPAADGMAIVESVLHSGLTQVLVSTVEVEDLLADQAELTAAAFADLPHDPAVGWDPAAVWPDDEVARSVAEVWHEVLGVPSIGPDDAFHDLGGNSLFAIQVMARLRQVHGDLPASVVFDAPTVTTLAAAIRAHQADGSTDHTLITPAPALVDRTPTTLAPTEPNSTAPTTAVPPPTPAEAQPAASTPARQTPPAAPAPAKTPLAASTPATPTPAETPLAAGTPAGHAPPAALVPAEAQPAASTPATPTPAEAPPAASTPARQTPLAAPVPVGVRRGRRVGSTMDFSLFFFSGDGSAEGAGKYDLLLDCARYADRHGFAAIWVPERHFVDFGGLYPNPAVVAAAVAAVTERVGIRAGSVAVPLHHPARIAEEWAVVDNLSGGRVAISAASGWHPDDFLLAPGADPDRHRRRKDVMFESLEVVQRLWAGESVPMARPDGTTAHLRTLPRPLQPRLPVWISSQGSVDTFARAGEVGANVLTALVGGRLGDLADKVAAYREALPRGKTGRVAVMAHTFLGTDDDAVKRTVREPLIAYLKSFLSQQDTFDSAFAQLDDAGREAMLSSAFERYFDDSALLGTPDKCESLVEDLVDVGVDEVACLVDFGPPPAAVLEGLKHLTELKDRYAPGADRA
ncbi:MAG: LLM class flavin-dependent oxidoreductase [Saccharothrix sp.]|nr:LLM class flavin-dependent oxidoreductase [Saccharothrix sp.]